MRLSKPVVVLAVAVIVLFAIVIGMGAAILELGQRHDVIAAVETGFAAAGSAVLVGCALVGVIAIMI